MKRIVEALLPTGRRMVCRLEVSLNKSLWPEAVSSLQSPNSLSWYVPAGNLTSRREGREVWGMACRDPHRIRSQLGKRRHTHGSPGGDSGE